MGYGFGNHQSSRARPDEKMSPATVRYDSRPPAPQRKDERTEHEPTAYRQVNQRIANRKRRQRDATAGDE